MLTVRLFEDSDKDSWDRYVQESESASCYHLAGWNSIIRKSFGHKTFYLLAEDSPNNVKGILPLVQLKSMLFGNFMVSVPFFNYGGLLSLDSKISELLVSKAIEIAHAERATHIEFRHKATFPYKDLKETSHKVCMELELPETADELFGSFPSKLRSQIRRPTKEGMCVRLGGEEELESFYSVFAVNMRDLGTPVYSKEFFRNIIREFSGTNKICTVYAKTGQPVASAFLLGFKNTLETPWAASLKSYARFSPNMLLYWESLRFACDNGYKIFDFGRSSPNSGTYRFKAQWGAKPLKLYWYYWLGENSVLPQLNPSNPKYKLAINVWKKLPLSITKLAGPMIVKNLP